MANNASSTRSSEAINKASNLSAQGKDKQALDLIRKHLRQAPRDIAALNLAGTLAARMEDWKLAEQFLTDALTLKAENPFALYSLSKIFKLSNRPGDAVDALTRLLKIERHNVAALNEMGVLLSSQGHLDEALKAFETAIEIDPNFEKPYGNLYATLYTAGHYETATEVAKRAIARLSTEHCWKVRRDLILCLWKTRAFEEAKQTAEALISELDPPGSPEQQELLLQALNNYGIILMEVDDADLAEVQFRKIISLAPKMVDPYVNMAKLNIFRENFQEVIYWFEQAIAVDPEHAQLHNHLALFLVQAGRPDLALPHHLSTITRSPGNPEYRFYLGMTLFALGRLEEAYPNWELRWARREVGEKSNLPIPEWAGTPNNGQSILVYREQGIGDEIIFVSCLTDIVSRFERVVCVCHSKLEKLFARSFPSVEFHSGEYKFSQSEIAALQWQVPMGSLPTVFRPDVPSFQSQTQLLTPDASKVEEFRQRLRPKNQTLTIGISWRSTLLTLERRALYPYLHFWQAIFNIPGITWVNLQYGDVGKELIDAETQFGVSIVNFPDVDHFNDLDTSSALMKACDLVIGPSTSTTMLSAAVNVPTIRIADGYDPYQLGTDHYPWLPTLTPIPRHFGESWQEPIQRTALIIQALVAERSA